MNLNSFSHPHINWTKYKKHPKGSHLKPKLGKFIPFFFGVLPIPILPIMMCDDYDNDDDDDFS